MPTALTYAVQILSILPQLLAAGKDVAALVQSGNAALKQMADEGREPTTQEWDALNAQIDALRAELHEGEDSKK